jgi:elongation factor Ts
MAITAAQVKELRERTGAGMMECKKALVENDGDMEAAIEALRKSGIAKADKKAGRVAAEGIVVAVLSDDGKAASMIEVNAETDFVAKREEFTDFSSKLADCILSENPDSLEVLMNMTYPGSGSTIEDTRKELIAKIGENIGVRRFVRMQSSGDRFGVYQHGVRIGVLVEIQGGSDELAKDIAMHIAASKPLCVSESEVPGDVIAKEREIYAAQAAESGKPDNIIEKMVEGRLKKFLNEITLLGQPFVKDPDINVGKLLKDNSASVVGFERMEVGEGIEKKSENFAEEVMAQVKQ